MPPTSISVTSYAQPIPVGPLWEPGSGTSQKLVWAHRNNTNYEINAGWEELRINAHTPGVTGKSADTDDTQNVIKKTARFILFVAVSRAWGGTKKNKSDVSIFVRRNG